MAEYLSRTGSVIVILTLLFVAVILATQFSFGRLFSAMFAGRGARSIRVDACASGREERRKARERREVIAKHVKKGGAGGGQGAKSRAKAAPETRHSASPVAGWRGDVAATTTTRTRAAPRRRVSRRRSSRTGREAADRPAAAASRAGAARGDRRSGD